MAIYRSDSSLSKCDPNVYNGLYGSAKPRAPVQESRPSVPKDTLEFSGDQLKKEALGRLRHKTKYVIFKNSFMRIGNVLFVAVAFTPYMLLYKLPKWVMVEFFPLLTSKIMIFTGKITNKVRKGIGFCKQKSVQVIEFFRQMAAPLIQPLVNIWKAMQNSIRRFRHQIQKVINQVREKVNAVVNVPSSAINFIGEKISNRFNKVKSAVLERGVKVKNRIAEILGAIKSFPQALVQWSTVQLRNLQEYLLRWPRKWKTNFRTSQRIAKVVTEWLSQKLQQLKEQLKQMNLPSTDSYSKTFKPRLERVMSHLNGWLKNGRDNLDRRKKRFVQALKSVEGKIRAISLQQLYDAIHSFAGFIGFADLWLKFKEKFLIKFIVKALLTGSLKIASFASLLMLQLTRYLTGGLFNAVEYILTGLSWVVSHFTQGLDMVMSKLTNLFAFIGKSIRKSIYLCLLMFVMAIIILFWGMRSAKRALDYQFGIKSS